MRTPTPAAMPQRCRVLGYELTPHAWLRMKQMGLTPAEVEWVLEEPDDSWVSQKYIDTHPHAMSHARGDYGVIVEESRKVVITVLWRSKRYWEQRVAAGLER